MEQWYEKLTPSERAETIIEVLKSGRYGSDPMINRILQELMWGPPLPWLNETVDQFEKRVGFFPYREERREAKDTPSAMAEEFRKRYRKRKDGLDVSETKTPEETQGVVVLSAEKGPNEPPIPMTMDEFLDTFGKPAEPEGLTPEIVERGLKAGEKVEVVRSTDKDNPTDEALLINGCSIPTQLATKALRIVRYMYDEFRAGSKPKDISEDMRRKFRGGQWPSLATVCLWRKRWVRAGFLNATDLREKPKPRGPLEYKDRIGALQVGRFGRTSRTLGPKRREEMFRAMLGMFDTEMSCTEISAELVRRFKTDGFPSKATVALWRKNRKVVPQEVAGEPEAEEAEVVAPIEVDEPKEEAPAPREPGTLPKMSHPLVPSGKDEPPGAGLKMCPDDNHKLGRPYGEEEEAVSPGSIYDRPGTIRCSVPGAGFEISRRRCYEMQGEAAGDPERFKRTVEYCRQCSYRRMDLVVMGRRS